jgi:hypothetical protein
LRGILTQTRPLANQKWLRFFKCPKATQQKSENWNRHCSQADREALVDICVFDNGDQNNAIQYKCRQGNGKKFDEGLALAKRSIKCPVEITKK